ncbi:MSHA biogenesis protein MshL [Tamilnaduibacter salinus]|uniref:MSHA biogenesis protein MshL n=1 Tax=Tamilnaduibacter salinus TaxID=1484056 RepID=A0A2U1CTY8_9GAMM|nr:pilus (MSHA type) biogenesis protein MshL [Tamilnaduibacter salinus]PVY70311.1 MSHA biogenesis protein MshL [Tamilnaduibacter salinus]
MTHRCSRTGWLVVLALLFSGCAAEHPLMRSGQATSTDAAQAIDEELAKAEKVTPETGTSDRSGTVPKAVTDALMPSLAEPATSSDERFDVAARGLAVADFFAGLVDGTDYNVVVHPQVTGTISLNLRDVSLPEVMDVVDDLHDFRVTRHDRLYKVLPGGLQTRLFPIDYLHLKRQGGSETRVNSGQVSSVQRSGQNGGGATNGDDGGRVQSVIGTRISTETESRFWSDLRSAVSTIVGSGNGRKVITTPGAGLVVVRAEPDELAAVERYLRKAELIMKRQVVIEAKVLEIALDERYEQGINWSDLQSASRVTASDGLPEDFTAQALAGVPITSSDIGGVFSASVRAGDFTALIELLGRQGNVQTLSSPRISTVNNQKAVIKVGSDEFFVTDIEFDDEDNAAGTTDSTSTSVELTPFFSGISLDVTPQISENGTITLHVHPSVSEVSDQEKVITVGDRDVTLPLALSTVRETDSVIKAQSGQIVVIGGLIQNKSEDNNAAVPFFSEIPWIGELFKQRRFESRKSELVILLRPVVTGRGEGTMRADVSRSRERMQVLRELLEEPSSPLPEPAQPGRE